MKLYMPCKLNSNLHYPQDEQVGLSEEEMLHSKQRQTLAFGNISNGHVNICLQGHSESFTTTHNTNGANITTSSSHTCIDNEHKTLFFEQRKDKTRQKKGQGKRNNFKNSKSTPLTT